MVKISIAGRKAFADLALFEFLSELYFSGKILPVGVVPSYFLQNTIGELFAPTHTNT